MSISIGEFEERNFFELFISTTILSGNDKVIEQKQVEKNMYKYVDNYEYSFLFNNICVDNSEKTINLNHSFKYGLSFGLINYLDEKKDKNIINLTEYEASERIKKYNQFQIKAMSDMCNDYYNKEDKNKVLIKK